MELIVYLALYTFAFVLLYVFLPKLLFLETSETGQASLFSNFIRMNLLVIVTSYLLVVMKLYEVPALLFVFITVIIYNKRKVMKMKNRYNFISEEIYYWIYDYTDGLIRLPLLISSKIQNKWRKISLKWRSFTLWDYLYSAQVLVVFTYAAVMRMTDVFQNAAPAMSDAYVTLAWIKYIGSNQLFHDGIYPQGYHIHMSLLQKFTSLDAMHILKFSGPFTSLLILFSLYFFVSELLKNKTAGVLSVAVYGIFGRLLSADVNRQVATNAQEYGFLFILPCLFFIYRYLNSDDRRSLYIAGAALLAAGLIHLLSFCYLVIWIIVLYAVFLVKDPKSALEKFKPLLITGIAASFGMMVPVLYGLLSGISFHSASLEFAVSKGDIPVPSFRSADYIVIASLGFALIYIIVQKAMHSLPVICLFFIGVASACMYFFGGTLTKSVVIGARTGEVYALISAAVMGMGFYCLMSLFLDLQRKAGCKVVTAVGLTATVTLLLIFLPKPIIPYKMEYNSFTEQYYKITKDVRNTEWLMVSQEEGYATCLGKGWHLMAKDFLETVDPKNPFSENAIESPYLFIYIEEEPYETYKEMDILQEAYQRRLKESALLKQWVKEYQQVNGDAEIVLQDPHLTVVRIERPSMQEQFIEKVLGPKS